MAAPPNARDRDRAVPPRQRARTLAFSRPALALSLLLMLGVLPGCWEWAHRIYPIPFYETSVNVGGDRARMREVQQKIAVLPFTFEQKDNPERREAVETLRVAFDTGLGRLRSYGLLPLEDVDARLEKAGISRDQVPGMNPAALGRIVGAGVLLYGDVKRTRNITLWVYSHTVYEGTFRLVEASTGDVLWSGRLWEGERGGLIVDLFLIEMFMNQPENTHLPEAYRRIADLMVRKLIAEIPEPLPPAAEAPAAETPVAQPPPRSKEGS